MSEEAIRNTRKMMMSRPEVMDHIAYNVWKHETGRWGSQAVATEWAAMPAAEKEAWKAKAWAECEAHWAATPDEQKARAAAGWKRTLAINDAEYARLCAEGAEPGDVVDPSWSTPQAVDSVALTPKAPR